MLALVQAFSFLPQNRWHSRCLPAWSPVCRGRDGVLPRDRVGRPRGYARAAIWRMSSPKPAALDLAVFPEADAGPGTSVPWSRACRGGRPGWRIRLARPVAVRGPSPDATGDTGEGNSMIQGRCSLTPAHPSPTFLKNPVRAESVVRHRQGVPLREERYRMTSPPGRSSLSSRKGTVFHRQAPVR
jgi:hypothetical protein